MALKGERRVLLDESRFKCDTATNRGVILVYSGSGGSGINPDSGYLATLPGTGSVSGLVPVGLLLNDVVSLDESRYHLNRYKTEERVNGKCTLLKKGFVWTDAVKSGDTPSQGVSAYLAASGQVSTTSTNAALIGKFGSQKTSDGFVLLQVDLP